jgi:S1-C subfamily serine protease
MYKTLGFLTIILCLVSCDTYRPDDVLNKYRSAVGLLRNGDGICTTFHAGEGLFVTAKHCVEIDGPTSLIIQDSENELHIAHLVYVDPENDIAIMQSDELEMSMEIWSKSDGKLMPGKQIMTMGYPGYYMAEFMFEVGYIVNVRMINGKQFIVSKNLAYPGQSGGPVVMVENGKVVGIAIALSERIRELNEDGLHLHNTLTIILPWDKVEEAINKAKETTYL